MPLQILTLKLDGITAGDYLTWCRDPDPPALDYALRSITIKGDPLGDTITAILDWNQPPPAPPAAATAAGLTLPAAAQLHALTPPNGNCGSEQDATSTSAALIPCHQVFRGTNPPDGDTKTANPTRAVA